MNMLQRSQASVNEFPSYLCHDNQSACFWSALTFLRYDNDWRDITNIRHVIKMVLGSNNDFKDLNERILKRAVFVLIMSA